MAEETLAEVLPVSPAVDYRTVEGLRTHPLFQMLTTKQQDFLLTYIETNGDRIAAVTKVYGSKKPDQIGMRVMRTTYIRKLIAIYYGYEIDQVPMGKKELAGLIAARLRRANIRDEIFTRLTDYFMELTFRKKTLKHPGRPTDEEREKTLEEGEENIDRLVQAIEREKRKQEKE
jgi:hypothetical protein